MPEPQRGPQTFYAAVILAALVAVIVVARRWQSEPSAPAWRAAPQLAGSPANHPREPRPLAISAGVPPIPSDIRGEVPAGFPAEEGDDDVGPIMQQEASVYGPVEETPTTKIPGMRRLAPVEPEDASEPAPAPVSTSAVPQAEVRTSPQRPHVVDDNALRPVLQQAAQLNRQAESLARRGAYYLARNRTIQSLRMIAEALDLQTDSGEHTAALASALSALREAGDFQSRSSEDSTVSVPLVVAGHRTPVLRQQSAEGLSAVAAQQQYYNFARQQLVIAAGGQSVASHALCNMGKLQSRMGEETAPQQTNLARSMVYQQAALAVDGRNYPAANELGNILTAFGQLPEARRILLHSVGTVSNPEGWHSLAAVHDRLGETELAAHARKQLELLTGGKGGPRPKVEWVSPEVFAGNPPAASGKATAAATSGKSDQRTADTRPKQKETWLSPFGIKR
jgi:tetratricopeptide (TPR) repeat protein